jgi:transcriptional regulator with XRE-family HTH domain
MEFHEKLQELRKARGLTQEELAEALYVSRAAVSKWESGRGYPGIDSLKAISKYFSITIDELLSGNELLSAAEDDSKQKQKHICELVFGLLDCTAALLFFLPFFAQRAGESVQSLPLPLLTEISLYLKIAFYIAVIGMTAFGILALSLQNCKKTFWEKYKSKLSLLINAAGILLFIISLQAYAASFLLVILIVKALIAFKRQ